ncbi:TonB-dependent receptor [Vitreimonas flagellata]|uniref:TonB-dependent receptor n=1 Tax=Vitreimonas flagellata TaxID=2560861 RepID=UPI0010756183|nr:TonB-dependent receptor [Vitreimonas flagellata]
MKKQRKLLLTAVSAMAMAFALSAMTPMSAYAQDADDETIIVTATKRESTIQDVPFSVNAQSQEDIERSGSTNLEDISRNVAGMSIQNLGPGQSQVSLRGVSAGQIVRDQPGVKEQVGVYLDESVISLSLFTPDLDLYDLNRVETLRGPQGTLFGSGSVGGTIRYITNQPDLEDFSAGVEANVNTIDGGSTGGHLKGMINMPLVPGTLALRVTGYHTEYAGFIDALREGGGESDDVNDGARSGLRAALTWQVTPDLTVTPRIVYQNLEVNGFNRQEVFNLFANPFTTTRDPVTFNERQQFLLLDEEFSDETFLADLTVNYDMGDVNLTSITSFVNRNILASRDASALTGSVSVDLAFPDAAVLLPSNLRDTTELEQFTQEVRLSSDTDGPFQWLIGAFYSDVQRDYAQRLPTPGYDAFTDATLGAGTAAATANGYGPDSPYNSDLPYSIEQFAVFGEASYEITDRLTLTAGARYYDFSEERDFISGGLFSNGDNRTDTTSSDGVTPRVIASYDVTDEIAVNVQASQGFRLGGVNDPLNLPLCSDEDEAIFGGFQTYGDETSWNYEAGVKVTRSNYTFNAAAFYNEISDLQVTLDAGSCSSRISFNVPEAHASGIEVEFGWQPLDGLELSVAGSWTEAEFDSTVRDGNDNVLGGIEAGNRLASVPEYQVAATAAYYFPLAILGEGREAFVAGSVQHVGSRFTQPGDQVPGAGNFVSGLPFGGATGADVTALDLELDAYTIINLSAGVEGDDWGVTLFVNNAADENANLSFDRERGGRARLAFATNQPRTIGVTVRRAF